MHPVRRTSLVAGVAALAVVVDAATKSWAVAHFDADSVSLLGGWLVLTEGRNPGAAFGLATSLTPLLSVVAVVVFVGIALAARRARTRGTALALGLIAGGAGGNLVDRLLRSPGPLRGHVVDWIDIGAWPTFNLADTAIVIGAIVLVLTHGRPGPRAGADPARAS